MRVSLPLLVGLAPSATVPMVRFFPVPLARSAGGAPAEPLISIAIRDAAGLYRNPAVAGHPIRAAFAPIPSMEATMQAKYRQALPQMGEELFLTDGGLETTLIFHEGLELPHFAAFMLLRRTRGGRRSGATSRPTWRSPARPARAGRSRRRPGGRTPTGGHRLGYDAAALDAANAAAVALRRRAPRRAEAAGDADRARRRRRPARRRLPAGEPDDRRGGRALSRAADRRLAAPGRDMVTALTMTYPEEAIGIVRAAAAAGCPCVVSFTVETDGRLPTGHAARRRRRGLSTRRPAAHRPTTW